MNGKLVQVAVLLATMVVASSQALDCDFQLAQSTNGKLTRVQVGCNTLAIIKLEDNKRWTGYVRSGKNITISDHTGSANTTNFSELPEEEQKKIEQLIGESTIGMALGGKAGKFVLESSNGQVLDVDTNKHGSISVIGNGLDAYLYANKANLNYNHIFFFLKYGGTGVIEVDNECNVEVYPIGKLGERRLLQGGVKVNDRDGPASQLHAILTNKQ